MKTRNEMKQIQLIGNEEQVWQHLTHVSHMLEQKKSATAVARSLVQIFQHLDMPIPFEALQFHLERPPDGGQHEASPSSCTRHLSRQENDCEPCGAPRQSFVVGRHQATEHVVSEIDPKSHVEQQWMSSKIEICLHHNPKDISPRLRPHHRCPSMLLRKPDICLCGKHLAN